MSDKLKDLETKQKDQMTEKIAWEEQLKKEPWLAIDTNDPVDYTFEAMRAESEAYVKFQKDKTRIIQKARDGIKKAKKQGKNPAKFLLKKRTELQELYNERQITISDWAWHVLLEHDSELCSDEFDSENEY